MRRLKIIRRAKDEGVALVAVVGTMVVLTLMLTAALAYALNNSVPARKDQDAKTAESAAQAGLDEYISRLNGNSNYWTLGNTGDTTNLAFTTGAAIQGTSGSTAKYTYKLLTTNADTAQTGQIRIQVTGTSSPAGRPAVSRTLSATLTPRGYLSFIYLSDVEVIDPTLVGDVSACGNYYYSGRSSRTDCAEIQWGANDTVNGPLHSNDALQISSSSVNFTNPQTETSWPATSGAGTTAKTWWGSATYPLTGYKPHYAASVSLPTVNDNMQQYVTPGADGTQTGTGCYYTGATRIIFQGTTMKVLSPATSSSLTPSRCLDVSNRANEQTKPIPPVIYVDRTTNSCTLGAVGYPASGEKYTAGSSGAASWGNTTNYTCTRGTAYISGAADTQVTVATNDDIVVTGDLTDTDNGAGTDVIGLNAGNYVWVYHPLNSSSANLLSASAQLNNIQAAILSLNHSFVVQNWSSGATLGTLNITGAISQKFRGPVATSSSGTIVTGYVKNYDYDERLAYLSPPYFLADNSQLAWQVASETDK